MSYFKLVNEKGGIHGRKIDVIVKDDRYEPDPAVQNTNDLITKNKAFFLLDYVGTPTLTRVLPLLRYYKDQTSSTWRRLPARIRSGIRLTVLSFSISGPRIEKRRIRWSITSSQRLS